MKETDLRGKACVVPMAIAASLGMAGMGLVSNRVAMADVTSITDTINVIVQPTCTFNSVQDKTYAGSALNGTEVENFDESGVHEFHLFCNNNDGYTVRATPYDLEATGINDVIAYTANYTPSGKNGLWTAAITTSEPSVIVTSPVPVGGGVIISSDTNSSADMSFTATYSAYVGSETPAGTYTGRIEYVLSSLNGTVSNSGNGGDSGNSGSNDNGEGGGDNSGGSEVTDSTDTPDNTDSGGSGAGGSGTGDTNSGGSNETPTPSNTQNAAPMALNNTYNTYSVTNTYGTTNYSGGGSNAPTVMSTQGVTSGSTNNATSEDNDSGNSEAGDDYEKPLGVTTTTSTSNKDSGVDLMPIVAAGAALAVAGVAAVALAQNNKEKE